MCLVVSGTAVLLNYRAGMEAAARGMRELRQELARVEVRKANAGTAAIVFALQTHSVHDKSAVVIEMQKSRRTGACSAR